MRRDVAILDRKPPDGARGRSAREFLALFAVLVLLAGGCSTHSATLDYGAIEEFTVRSGPIPDAEIKGEVEGRQRGAVWDGCSYAAHAAVWKMIRQAKRLGANAVGEIYWRDGVSPEPRCKKRWLYALFPPLIMTSLFMDAEVHGTAYRVSEPEAGVYLLPSDPEEEELLVARIIAESCRADCRSARPSYPR